MASLSLLFIIFVIILALVFDFTNGMHDAANSISTIVSTRVLSPRVAVVWAAFFNFVAFLIFGTGVATTIGKGMINWRLCRCRHSQKWLGSDYPGWLVQDTRFHCPGARHWLSFGFCAKGHHNLDGLQTKTDRYQPVVSGHANLLCGGL